MSRLRFPRSLGAWWRSLIPGTITDPFQRRVYPLLYATIAALGLLDLLGLIVSLLRIAGGEPAWVTAGLYAGLVSVSAAGFWLARSNAFQASVLLMAVGLLVVQALGLLSGGVVYAGIMLAAMLTSIVFAGLLLGWKGGGAITALSVACAAAVGALEARGLLSTALEPGRFDGLIFSNVFVHACLAVFVLVIVVSFRNALNSELALTHSQELALRTARDSLQEQVSHQTEEIRRALEESERRAQRLAETLSALARSEAAVRQLEAPIIPVLPGVILVPLVGQVDRERLQQMGERVLAELVARRGRSLIIDVTSVQIIDTATAKLLLSMASSARLVGAETVLVGVGPEVAQTIVSLGITLSLPTFATLEQAVSSFLAQPSARRGGASLAPLAR